MPDYTQRPQPIDLQTLLESAELYDAAWNLDLAGALQKADEDLQQDSGFRPFLAGPEATVRRFTPDGPSRRYASFMGGGKVLFLETGLLDLVSLTVDGRPHDREVDFFMEPENAMEESRPFTQVYFPRGVMSQRQGIVITALFGFCIEYPATVFEGLKCKAALHLAPIIASKLRQSAERNQQAGVVKAKETGPVRIEFAAPDAAKTNTLSTQISGWETAYKDALSGRRLMGI